MQRQVSRKHTNYLLLSVKKRFTIGSYQSLGRQRTLISVIKRVYPYSLPADFRNTVPYLVKVLVRSFTLGHH